MTTTTGDPSTLKNPASLSSGDLVSRLLAATPPYLYNVPLTPHSFFFSEMLRSFVQAKTDALALGTSSSAPNRRRKRTWKESAAGPLELTTTERRGRHAQPPHHHHQPPPEKYFHHLQHVQPENHHVENRVKVHEGYEEKTLEPNKAPEGLPEVLRGEEAYGDFKQKNYFADRVPQGAEVDVQKLKSEEIDRKSLYNEKISDPSIAGQKSKLDFSVCNFLPNLPPGKSEDIPPAKGFPLPGNPQNPDFLPAGPMWYPPYPISQSYPGIDPLHFFIDLRVSGRIWDQKLGSEKQIPFKSKHSSAFSVPQSKDSSNRPLNLTRSEAGTSKSPEEVNTRGPHYILKNISRTYREIHDSRVIIKCDVSEAGDDKTCEDDVLSKKEENSSGQEEEKIGIRAIIGHELHDHPSNVTE